MEAGQPTVNSPYSTARTVPIGEVANGSEVLYYPACQREKRVTASE